MGLIKAIFYARFHTKQGPHVLHQVPEGAISPTIEVAPLLDSSNDQPQAQQQQPLFAFPLISSLIIPPQEFCDRLITVCVNHYRVISHPVCVENVAKYDRNQFIFNFGLVLEESVEDWSGYGSVVRKVGGLFRNLEEQGGWLSEEERRGGVGDVSPVKDSNADEKQKSQVYALCEMMFEDLNHYTECMIPIDPSNIINLKIFPTRPSPPPVFPWHVPLTTVALPTLTQASVTDLTLSRIIPHIDGIASVAHIAEQADVDLGLARKAVAHLLYYNCVLLLDIFTFAAQYAITPDFAAFVEDTEGQDEALGYVTVGQYRKLTEGERLAESRLSEAISGSKVDAPPVGSYPSKSEQQYHGSNTEVWGWRPGESGISRAQLVELYASFKQGVSLRTWCLEHNVLLLGVDVRRLVTFGVIKGFLYRSHRYAILDAGVPMEEAELIKAKLVKRKIATRKARGREEDEKMAAVEADLSARRMSRPGSIAAGVFKDDANGDEDSRDEEIPMIYYLDGQHCFDEICTDLCISEAKVMEKMKDAYKNVTFISR